MGPSTIHCKDLDVEIRHLTGTTVPILLLVYVIYMTLFALAPFTLSAGPSESFSTLFVERFDGVPGILRVTFWDVWTNIFFFVPYGLMVVLLPRISSRSWVRRLLWASTTSLLLSCSMELAQVFFERAPSLADIICNTLGGSIGAALGIWALPRLAALGLQCSPKLRLRSASSIALFTYGFFLVAMIALPLPAALDFSNWDQSYRLFVGNEGTLDRSWRGTLYMVALYDRALTVQEVQESFSAGVVPWSRESRARDGLLAYYDFSENTGDLVRDRSGAGYSVDLRIEDSSRVEWAMPRGLTLKAGAVVSSPAPPARLKERLISKGSELSVEAWFIPADLAQTGPARIVSYSVDRGARNFTIGQQNGDVVFRLRTPASGLNGVRPSLKTYDSPLNLTVQHVVATYRAGIEKLYLNGKEHVSLLLRSTVIDKLVQGVGESFRWLIDSAMIFPLGLFTNQFAKTRYPKWTQAGSLLTAFMALSLVYGLRWLIIGEGLEPFVLPVAMITLVAAAAIPFVVDGAGTG